MKLAKFTNDLIFDLVDDDFLMKNNGERYYDVFVVVTKIIKEWGVIGGYDTINTSDKNKIYFKIVIDGINVSFEYNIIGIIRRKKLEKIMKYE